MATWKPQRWHPRPSKLAPVRTPQIYVETCAEPDVENAERYQPDVHTWCNIYVSDVTRALACEIPHWWEGRELTANKMATWLATYGAVYGWLEVDEDGARIAASAGRPTVVSWQNRGVGSGHIAMVLPPHNGHTVIAQAGRECGFGIELADGFGAAAPLRFYAHD